MRITHVLLVACAVAAALASEPPSDEVGDGEGTPIEPMASTSLGEDAEAVASAAEQAPRDTFTGRPIDGAPRFEKQAAKGDRASMQWIVTKTMQRELTALGYTRPEIDSIDAQRAVEVIKLKIRRPSRGMPRRWRKDSAGAIGAVVASTRDLFTRALGSAGPAVLLVALALAGVSVVATQGGGAGGAAVSLGQPRSQKRSRASASAFATEGDEYVAPPGRLWLDVQIDRFEWWLKNRNRRAKY